MQLVFEAILAIWVHYNFNPERFGTYLLGVLALITAHQEAPWSKVLLNSVCIYFCRSIIVLNLFLIF